MHLSRANKRVAFLSLRNHEQTHKLVITRCGLAFGDIAILRSLTLMRTITLCYLVSSIGNGTLRNVLKGNSHKSRECTRNPGLRLQEALKIMLIEI